MFPLQAVRLVLRDLWPLTPTCRCCGSWPVAAARRFCSWLQHPRPAAEPAAASGNLQRRTNRPDRERTILLPPRFRFGPLTSSHGLVQPLRLVDQVAEWRQSAHLVGGVLDLQLLEQLRDGAAAERHRGPVRVHHCCCHRNRVSLLQVLRLDWRRCCLVTAGKHCCCVQGPQGKPVSSESDGQWSLDLLLIYRLLISSGCISLVLCVTLRRHLLVKISELKYDKEQNFSEMFQN